MAGYSSFSETRVSHIVRKFIPSIRVKNIVFAIQFGDKKKDETQ